LRELQAESGRYGKVGEREMGVPKLTPTELGIRHGRQLIKKLTRAELERIARRKPLNAYERAKISVVKEFLQKLEKMRKKEEKGEPKITATKIREINREIRGKIRNAKTKRQIEELVRRSKFLYTFVFSPKWMAREDKRRIKIRAVAREEYARTVKVANSMLKKLGEKGKFERKLLLRGITAEQKMMRRTTGGKTIKPAKRQTRKSKSVERDKKLKALPPGKRRSKSGKIYYEYRQNRSDLRGGV